MDRKGSLKNMIFVKRKIVKRKIEDALAQSSESEDTVRQMVDPDTKIDSILKRNVHINFKPNIRYNFRKKA